MSGDNWTPQNGEDYYGEDSLKENNYYNLFKNIQDETNFIKTKKKKEKICKK